MRSIKIAAALVATASAKAKVTNDYNILSIDGGGAKGIIPATIIAKMEKYAMSYAREKGYDVTPYIHTDSAGVVRKDQIHMTDLFDMLAGTSAGSLISSMLSIPIDPVKNQSPKYYGSEFYNIMKTDGGDIFKMQKFSYSNIVLTAFVGSMFMAAVGWLYGDWKYANKQKIRALEELEGHFKCQLNKEEDACRKIKMSHKVIENVADNVVHDMKNHNVCPEVIEKIQRSSRQIAQLAKDQKMEQKGVWRQMSLLGTAINEQNEVAKDALDEEAAFLQETIDEISSTRMEYERGAIKKWYSCSVCGFVGFLLFLIFPTLTKVLDRAGLERGGLDVMAKKYYGETTIMQAIPDELLIVSYSYNEAQPRFFSKQLKHEEPGIYDRQIREAAASSASMPLAWAPNKIKTQYNGQYEILIDGGIVANDPSMYAYLLASSDPDKYQKKNIRILSLSCGFNPPKGKVEVPGDFSKFNQQTDLESFAFGKIAQYTATSVMQNFIYKDKQYKPGKNDPVSYVRVVGPYKGSFISTEEKNLQMLQKSGEQMWEANKDAIKAFVRQTVDDKLGPKQQ